MTLHNCEIVDCDTSCEVILLRFSPKNLYGDFFDSLAMNPLFPTPQKGEDLISIYSPGTNNFYQ